MSAMPEPGPTPPAPPSPPSRTITLDLSRLPSAAAAVGVALVLASVVVSTAYARKHGELDGSVFSLGVVASLGLLAIAIAAELKVPGLERRAALVSWPGAGGIVGVGLMTAVLIDDEPALYVAPLLVLALSLGGFLVRRTAPFVLTGLLGLAVLYLWGVTQAIGDAGDSFIWVYGGALVVFVTVVTTLAWTLLPSMRVLVGVVTGAIALFFNGSGFFFPFYFLVAGFGVLGEDQEGNPFHDDGYAVLLYTALLILFWAVCAMASGHVGFRILIVAAAATMVPLALSLVAPGHPSWWQLGLGLLGGLALLVAALRAPDAADLPTGAGS
ncbi:MAG: hypothetical protein J7518_11480 [Nocardioidaceae bacterium]|nr:hypothetical protein [Nocardioidaceae bacterium]